MEGVDQTDALAELFEQLFPAIRCYIQRRVTDEAQADDLAAEVFSKALSAIRAGRGWHSSPRGWLFRIAHNLVIDLYRSRSRGVEVPIDEIAEKESEEGDPAAQMLHRMSFEQVTGALRRLTGDQAEVMKRRFLDEYSIAEVAEQMGKSEGAVKALQYRASASLRNLLGTAGTPDTETIELPPVLTWDRHVVWRVTVGLDEVTCSECGEYMPPVGIMSLEEPTDAYPLRCWRCGAGEGELTPTVAYLRAGEWE